MPRGLLCAPLFLTDINAAVAFLDPEMMCDSLLQLELHVPSHYARRLVKMLRRHRNAAHRSAAPGSAAETRSTVQADRPRYGDRVSVWIDGRVRPVVPIDSSIFHLLLARDRHTDFPPA